MKEFVYKFVISVFVFLLCLCGYNYKMDTSGLFNKDYSVPRVEPNQHFAKMEYIIEHPDRYDAYCFGSSRVGNIDLKKISNEHIYYNMTYSEGLPQEWLNDIQILLKNNVKISQVLIGIDDFSFRINPDDHKKQYLRMPYADNNIKTYFMYLLKKPKKPVTNKNALSRYDIYDSGRPLHPKADEKIEDNVLAHITSEKFNKLGKQNGDRIEQTLDEMKKIKEITSANNIELIVFVNPLNHVTYESNNLEQFNRFKVGLAQITDYYDFSGYNRITTNNYFYYESSHYRPLVGDMIVNRIFNMKKEATTDFGYYVTKDNVQQRIDHLNQEANVQ